MSELIVTARTRVTGESFTSQKSLRDAAAGLGGDWYATDSDGNTVDWEFDGNTGEGAGYYEYETDRAGRAVWCSLNWDTK